MRRPPLAFFSVVSTAVLILVIGLIVRTQIATDKLAIKCGGAILIESHPKHVLIFALVSPFNAGRSFSHERSIKEHALPAYSELRFGVQRGASTWWYAAIPFWLIVLIAAPLPTWELARRLQLKRRHRAGACQACGYDLRATPDRCPECGAVSAPASADKSSMQLTRMAIVLVSFLMMAGCIADPTLQRTELFFGMNRAGREPIADREWRAFVDEIVTPRFPSGLTILDARGQWRGASGAIESEPSRVMILLHAPSREEDRKIDEIRRLYKERFDQEAVMRTDSVERVSF